MNKRIGLFKMDSCLNDGVLEYSYKMKKGISRVEGGIYILKGMNFPDEIIDGIREQ
jgi:DNA mismatch repair ATPase MutS